MVHVEVGVDQRRLPVLDHLDRHDQPEYQMSLPYIKRLAMGGLRDRDQVVVEDDKCQDIYLHEQRKVANVQSLTLNKLTDTTTTINTDV